MTTIKKNLHWSAVVGVAFSFWLLIWLILIVAALYDIKELNSTQAKFAASILLRMSGGPPCGTSFQG